jgi:hypothetical protein
MRQERLAGRAPGRSSSTESLTVQHQLAPGKRTLAEAVAPVQMRPSSAAARPSPLTDPAGAGSTALRARSASAGLEALFGRPAVQQAGTSPAPAHAAQDASPVHAAAARGTATPASRLPYADQIQRAFGRHDISGVQAHVGSEAAASAHQMGARAYATGDHVVFDGAPDLHTAAHEAAHVVQQRGGVQLKGGVGEQGDRYERHADAVADRVVRGESASVLLDELAPSGAGGAPAVQRIVGQGLAQGTPIVWNGMRGIVLEEVEGVGYRVRVMTNAQPSIAVQPALPVPYNQLDPGTVPSSVPLSTSTIAPPQQDPPSSDHEVMAEDHGSSHDNHEAMDDDHQDGTQEDTEEPFSGSLEDLPVSVTLDGIAYAWQTTGSNSLLKPDDGRDYPHIWFSGTGDLSNLHFTSASYKSDTNQVSVIRRGYRWNGMHSRLQADPDFNESEQLLAVTANDGTHVTFDLSGGRQNQRVGVTAPHVGRPSVAELAGALSIPHE